jgi:DNA-binding response OmpR family regulator
MDGMSKILVVDDEVDFVELISFNFRCRGHEVLTAPNGLEALHHARRLLPDVIVMDVMMPGMDGFTLCEELRNHQTTQSIPVIIYTALAGQIARLNGMDAGAVDYLVKPFKMEQLVTRVEKVLERQKIKSPGL